MYIGALSDDLKNFVAHMIRQRLTSIRFVKNGVPLTELYIDLEKILIVCYVKYIVHGADSLDGIFWDRLSQLIKPSKRFSFEMFLYVFASRMRRPQAYKITCLRE